MLAEHLQGLEQDWSSALRQVDQAVHDAVREKVRQAAPTLAASFYREMMAQADASVFLNNDIVHQRLSSSLQHWLQDLFQARDSDEDIKALIACQVNIGEVHGRIDIPVHLVQRGGRMLKRTFSELYQAPFAEYQFFSQMVDIAIEVMSIAYHKNDQRNTRTEEAYRLFSITQNIGREKESQRAALLDWENHLLYEQAVGNASSRHLLLAQSEFGLWFRHKGIHAFEGAPECDQVLQQISQIDTQLLPRLLRSEAGHSDRLSAIFDIRAALKTTLFCLDSLFQRSEELENGKDVLTRLLNRKFLPAVMTKQLTMARQRNERFAVLAVDIDHFKSINDRYGHDNGDLVLQQFALLLANVTRSGDYTFRLGGEEFLVLLVDVDETVCMTIAEKIRQQIANEVFRLQPEQSIKVTASIGVSLYAGHPDYQYNLKCADQALYQAKQDGRDRVVMASGMMQEGEAPAV
ncbi:diguanylate cyclase [Idiomarina xiamenensis]|uniref:Diguanylate cyclase DosC n=1 Tax=Idiomarina xiamenensis 10-D-4 TaxID=740709 RepID=K2KYT9_9GAMM|nr:diguanylate cyclase [Idiomarina xiamenensis]EKE82895.1 diguanylate cyclase [Idiomarina xiamenensis 10-D-4]